MSCFLWRGVLGAVLPTDMVSMTPYIFGVPMLGEGSVVVSAPCKVDTVLGNSGEFPPSLRAGKYCRVLASGGRWLISFGEETRETKSLEYPGGSRGGVISSAD